MGRHLNLVENQFPNLEKRVFPRFPFSFLTFQAVGHRTFEVKDISSSGMQISLKDGEHTYQTGQEIEGVIRWQKSHLRVKGQVQWRAEGRLGMAFKMGKKEIVDLESLLSIDNLVNGLKPLHKTNIGLDFPVNLKYWLRNDGPVELFVWQHNNLEYSQFQLIIMENFVEWKDGKGVQTGKVVTKRNLETPLFSEDEFVFQIDDILESNRVNLAVELIGLIPNEFICAESKEFMLFKLQN